LVLKNTSHGLYRRILGIIANLHAGNPVTDKRSAIAVEREECVSLGENGGSRFDMSESFHSARTVENRRNSRFSRELGGFVKGVLEACSFVEDLPVAVDVSPRKGALESVSSSGDR
jgi:hypothetical protein